MKKVIAFFSVLAVTLFLSSGATWASSGDGAGAENQAAVKDATGPNVSLATANVALITGSYWTDDLYNFLVGTGKYNVSKISAYDCGSLAAYDVVVIYGNMSQRTARELDCYVSNGGGLVATPWAASNTWSWSDYVPNCLPLTSPDIDVYTGHQIKLTRYDGLNWSEAATTGYEQGDAKKATAFMYANYTDGTGDAVAGWKYGAGKAAYINMHYITSDCDRAVGSTAGNYLIQRAIDWAK